MNSKLITAKNFKQDILTLLCILLMFVTCSNNNIAGGVSEETNAKIIGAIVNIDGTPATNIPIALISENYNPALRNSRVQQKTFHDTTDSNGYFDISAFDSGSYNLQGWTNDKKYSFLITDIRLNSDPISIFQRLKLPGVLRILLPDSCDTNKGYVYIPGTTFYSNIKGNIDTLSGKYSVYIDNIPAGVIPSLSYSKYGELVSEKISKDTITIIPHDTTIVEAFTYWKLFTMENSNIPNNYIYDIAIDKNEKLWFGTRLGAATLNGNVWQSFDTANSKIPNNWVYFIGIDSTNAKWFGTFGGIAKYDDMNWEVFTSQNSQLPSNKIYTIGVTKNNVKWFGTDGGAVKLEDEIWTVYTKENSGLPNNSVHTVTFDFDGNIWLGTMNGGIAKFDGKNWEIYNKDNSNLLVDGARVALTDKSGKIWLGTYGGGLSFFNGTNWVNYTEENSKLPDNWIHSIAQDKEGVIWLGTKEGYVAGFNGAEWIVYNQTNSLIPDYAVISLRVDKNNNKWCGTRRGLGFFKNTTFYDSQNIRY